MSGKKLRRKIKTKKKKKKKMARKRRVNGKQKYCMHSGIHLKLSKENKANV